MIELEARIGRGKPYIALVMGTDPKFGLAREFLAARRGGKTISAVATVPGVYEVRDGYGESVYHLVGQIDEQWVSRTIAESTAYEIAEALDGGRRIEDLRLRRGRSGNIALRAEGGGLLWSDPVTRSAVVEQIRTLMREHDITLEDLA